MKRIIGIMLSMACCVAAGAIEVQKIYLKDGSVLSGYIQQQNMDGTMTVATDNAIVFLSGKVASVSNEHAYPESSLDKAWIDWAEKNGEFQGTSGKRTLNLGDVSVEKGKSVHGVKILEKGTVVKYLEMTSNTYTVKWKDVKCVRGEKRPRAALSGIDREYQLKNGVTHKGQYAEETDSTLSLYLDNGVVESFRIDDVVKYTYTPINPNQDIFEQSPLIDIVKTGNGAEVRGIIIEQNYAGKKAEENYILVREKSGAVQSVKLSDIKEVRKEVNSAYAPKLDILLNEGDVVVNRAEVEFVNVKESDGLLVLDSLSRKVTIAKAADNATKITVEYNDGKHANTEMFQLVRVTEGKIKKNKVYSFSYKDLVNSVYRATSIETSINGTTKAEYIVGGSGIFALYDAKNKRSITVTVE